jgi:hypothetical protein
MAIPLFLFEKDIAMTTQANESGYFNLHTSGIGYLNRVREVTPNGRGRKSEPFLACSIAGLHGDANDPSYTYFDVRVVGEEAIALVESLADAANDRDRKVLVVFNIWADPFIYEKGDRKGQPGASIKGRLLKIRWAKVDDEVVFQSNDDQPETDGQPEAGDDERADGDAGNAGEAPQARNVSQLSRQSARQSSRSRDTDEPAPARTASRFSRDSREDTRSTRFARTGTR